MREIIQTIIFDSNVLYVTLLIPEEKYDQYILETKQQWNITTRLFHVIFETRI